MKVCIRVKNKDTGRYRKVIEYTGMTYVRDSEHIPDSVFNTPFLIDSIFADSSEVYFSLTPAWNKKHPKEPK